ncbi:hypothetical protein [Pseudomonas amygdali]|uniref:hypothetical protein n=1 Tax=Pseudomonas amygdali TaxID=47877 RepID=UPI000A5AF0F4|nr:hypothetical protein [Pseudomonas amygdali]
MWFESDFSVENPIKPARDSACDYKILRNAVKAPLSEARKRLSDLKRPLIAQSIAHHFPNRSVALSANISTPEKRSKLMTKQSFLYYQMRYIVCSQ